MKEKMNNIFNKVKELFAKVKAGVKKLGERLKVTASKIKEQLKKINIINKIVAWARSNRLILSLVFFCVTTLALILIAVIGWNEFVVPVCVLVLIEVGMAVLLHKSELWIHGILLAAELLVGGIIDRLPLVILMVIVYVVAIFALHFGFKKESHE